jgi:hypothetical protein
MKNFDQHISQMAKHMNIDAERIYNMFLDTADTFLADYTGSTGAAEVWKATPEFWAWWQQIWEGRDRMVLNRYPERITAHNAFKMYTVWHDPKMLNARPNSVVYDGWKRTMKEKKILIKQLI